MRLLQPDVGEALDRLSILSLKLRACVTAGLKTDSFQREYDELVEYLDTRVPSIWPDESQEDQERYHSYRHGLEQVNARLWMLEDIIRQHRVLPEPHDDSWRLTLADIALEISEQNDVRARLVGNLNALFGAVESEKIYQSQSQTLSASASAAEGVESTRHKFHPFPSTKPRMPAGEALIAYERYEEAIPFLEQQYLTDPDSPSAGMTLSNLGICYRVVGRLQDSNNANARAVMKDPDNATIWANMAINLVDMGEHTAALQSAFNGYQLKPSDDQVAWVYTHCLLREGRWTEAWPIWEWARPRLFKQGEVLHRDDHMKEWRGEDFSVGARFLIIGEWGFGDAFMQLRYLGLLKERGAHITYVGWKRQNPVFEGHPWVDTIHSYVDHQQVPVKLKTEDFDYCVCIMDLPSRFGNMPATVPHADAYLNIPLESLNGSRLVATRKRRIGVCWQADEGAYSHRFRSYRDEEIAPLSTVDAEWYSLIPRQSTNWMIPHDPASWRDSAALISQLDLVVTVDTAVAHLAGALGKPTWMMLPAGSAWQWLRHRPTSVWYSSMRLFRSETPDDFLTLPERIASELR